MRLALVSLFAGLLGAQNISFLAPRSFTGAIEPSAIVSGDFNNDGRLDVLVSADGGYQLFAGNGDGTFRDPINTNNGFFNQIVTADFNRDGKLGAASIQTYDLTGAVYVSLGNGDGTFLPVAVYAVPNIATSIAAGDFNGDGIVDLAVSNGAIISVLLGRGDGTFAPPVNSAPKGAIYGIYGIAAADLNGDGKMDLAVIDSDKTGAHVQAFLGNGRGTFTPGAKALIDTSPVPMTIATADLRHTGASDVVVAGTNEAFVFLALGDGTFQPAATYPVLDGDSIAIADINGDGKPDLLVGDYYSNGVSVLLGNGDGTFQAQMIASAGKVVQAVAAGDFNGDGIADFAVTNGLSSSISVVLGNKQANFNVQTIPVASANAIVAADFNGDRLLDFATATISLSSNESQVFVYLGDGEGGFTQSAAATVPSAGWLVAGDFNGDGKPDLVAVSSNSISVMLGAGGGHLRAPHRISVERGLGTGVAADLNHDGKLDLAITVAHGNQIAIMLGNGDGTFQAPLLIPVHQEPYGIAAGDFNGDGIVDLAVTCQNAAEVGILLGKGDGSFEKPFYYATDSNPQYVAVGDLNGDGYPEVAVSNSSSNTITVLLGNGDGTFRSAGNLTACPYACFPRQLEMVDLNGDGKLDIAVAAQQTNALAVLPGKGDGTFAAPLFFGTGAGPVNLAAGRFSAGNLPSVLVVNGIISAIPGISVLVNTSQGLIGF